MTNELERWLKAAGWEVLRSGKGDHKILVYPPNGERFTCPAGRRLGKCEFLNLRAAARRAMRERA